jgi:hypothetical protein
VIFDTEQYYTRDEHYTCESVVKEIIELLEYPPSSEDDDIELEKLFTCRQYRDHELASTTQNTDSQIGGESSEPTSIIKKQSKCQAEPRDEDRVFNLSRVFTLNAHKVPEGYRAYGDVAPQNINLNLDTRNIVIGKHKRAVRNLDAFAVNFQTANLGSISIPEYLHAFSNEVSRPLNGSELPRIHQSQLPLLLKRVTDLNTHQYGLQFREVLQKKWRSLRAKGCFRKSNLMESTADAKVLSLM